MSPKDRRRFEDMAKQLFPDLARGCRAFLRHKDVLMSPRVLRSYNIQVVQARGANGARTACLAVGSTRWTSARRRGAPDCDACAPLVGALSSLATDAGCLLHIQAHDT